MERTGFSIVFTATGYEVKDRRVGVKSPDRVKNFHFSMSSGLALRPTQPHTQGVPGALSL
jgi:hypothetical protein